MPTFTNDLRLKEITTGDEDGTWGTSTNTNLALIADAFSFGTKQMAADANETFTMPDATADGTRSLYLKITSAVSLTVTRTVTLGPNTVSKVWIIENATTGSQSITIAQGSGSTVTIANGSKGMIVTDGAGSGAAVTNANPTTTAGTVTSVGGTGTVNGITLTGTVTSSGNLTLGGTLSGVSLTTQVTGTLPVANGGTGITSFGSGVAAALGVNVGSAGAPVLFDGALGTPSSGTLSSCTVDGTDAVGFRNVPQNSQSAAYTLVLADAGKHIFHPVGDNNARTFTIPANGSVAYPIGTAITFINMAAANVTIAITSDTLTLSPAGTTGSRTLATNGSATCIKITSTQWLISGSGLT
jgi:hypothetical protein